jgi:hypothetical protein
MFLRNDRSIGYVKAWSGEISVPWAVRIDLRKTGILAMEGFNGIGSWLVPGRMSNLLSSYAEVRFGAKKARSARIIPRRKTWGLSTREAS